MYLLSSVALYLTVLSGITLLFQYINAGFPDPVSPNYGLAGQVRWFVAMLIVVFPVFLWTARTLRKERDEVPEKGEIKVRKWLVYLTIFAVLLGYRYLMWQRSRRRAGAPSPSRGPTTSVAR